MSKITKKGKKATVKPGGNIVASMVEDFKEELKQTLENGAEQMTIDMTGVKMMDSMGIGVLVAAHNSLEKIGGQLELTKCSDDILSLLTHMRLNQHFKIR